MRSARLFPTRKPSSFQVMLRTMRNEQKPLQAQRDLMIEKMFE